MAKMTDAAPDGQGLHAALIARPGFRESLKHFHARTTEMLQEKRLARVDLRRNRP
jgi:hypothetical protein